MYVGAVTVYPPAHGNTRLSFALMLVLFSVSHSLCVDSGVAVRPVVYVGRTKVACTYGTRAGAFVDRLYRIVCCWQRSACSWCTLFSHNSYRDIGLIVYVCIFI